MAIWYNLALTDHMSGSAVFERALEADRQWRATNNWSRDFVAFGL